MNEADSSVTVKKLLFVAIQQLSPGVSSAEAAHHAVQAFEIAGAVLDGMAEKGGRFERKRTPAESRQRQAERRLRRRQLPSRPVLVMEPPPLRRIRHRLGAARTVPSVRKPQEDRQLLLAL